MRKKMMPIRVWGILLLPLVLAGCETMVGASLDKYMAVAPDIKLGMTQTEVLNILRPTHAGLTHDKLKATGRYKRADGVLVEVHYFRSGWQRDGITTDDEFTPYVFENGVLMAIGWETLGGPKTQGQTPVERDSRDRKFHR